MLTLIPNEPRASVLCSYDPTASACSDNMALIFARHKDELCSRPYGRQCSILQPIVKMVADRVWKILSSNSLFSSFFQSQFRHSKPILSPLQTYTQLAHDFPSDILVEKLESDEHVSIAHAFNTDIPVAIEEDRSLQRPNQTSLLNIPRYRPELPPPSLHTMMFEAYRLMSTMNQKRLRDCKLKMQVLAEQRTRLENEKIEQWTKQRNMTHTAKQWSTAMTVFSWVSSCLEVFSGIAMIAMGNVVGGSLLLAGGVLQLTSHIMMQTGGWDKIAEKLPGDNLDEKKKVISWLQIGIAIFSMMLAGAGGAIVGTGGLSPAMRTASSMATAGLFIGGGVVTMVSGIWHSKVKNSEALLQRLTLNLHELDFDKQNLSETIEKGVKFHKRCSDMIGQAIKQNHHLASQTFRPIT